MSSLNTPKLVVTITSLRNLQLPPNKKDNQLSIIVQVNKDKHELPKQNASVETLWNEVIFFDNIPDVSGQVLQITIKDKTTNLGYMTIPFESLVVNNRTEFWYPIKNSSQATIGELHVATHYLRDQRNIPPSRLVRRASKDVKSPKSAAYAGGLSTPLSPSIPAESKTESSSVLEEKKIIRRLSQNKIDSDTKSLSPIAKRWQKAARKVRTLSRVIHKRRSNFDLLISLAQFLLTLVLYTSLNRNWKSEMEQHDPSTMLADVVAAFFLRALANGIIYAFGSTSGIRKMVSYVGLTLVIIYLLFKMSIFHFSQDKSEEFYFLISSAAVLAEIALRVLTPAKIFEIASSVCRENNSQVLGAFGFVDALLVGAFIYYFNEHSQVAGINLNTSLVLIAATVRLSTILVAITFFHSRAKKIILSSFSSLASTALLLFALSNLSLLVQDKVQHIYDHHIEKEIFFQSNLVSILIVLSLFWSWAAVAIIASGERKYVSRSLVDDTDILAIWPLDDIDDEEHPNRVASISQPFVDGQRRGDTVVRTDDSLWRSETWLGVPIDHHQARVTFFDGTEDYIHFSNFKIPEEAVTISAWAYCEKFSQDATIFTNMYGKQGNLSFGLSQSGFLSVKLVLQLEKGIEVIEVRDREYFPLKKWQHVAVIIDGAFVRLMRNGIEVENAELPFKSRLFPSSTKAAIGCCLGENGEVPLSKGSWNGRIADVQVWSSAREQHDVVNDARIFNVHGGSPLHLLKPHEEEALKRASVSSFFSRFNTAISAFFISADALVLLALSASALSATVEQNVEKADPIVTNTKFKTLLCDLFENSVLDLVVCGFFRIALVFSLTFLSFSRIRRIIYTTAWSTSTIVYFIAKAYSYDFGSRSVDTLLALFTLFACISHAFVAWFGSFRRIQRSPGPENGLKHYFPLDDIMIRGFVADLAQSDQTVLSSYVKSNVREVEDDVLKQNERFLGYVVDRHPAVVCEFDGQDDHVFISQFWNAPATLPDTSDDSVQEINSVTVSAWILPFKTINSDSLIFSTAGFNFSLTNNRTLNLELRTTDGAGKLYGTTKIIPLGQWTHVAFTANRDEVQFYVNGELIESNNPISPGGAFKGSKSAAIGCLLPAPSKYWVGRIAHVFVWDYTRSADEIVEDMNTATPFKELHELHPAVQGFWHPAIATLTIILEAVLVSYVYFVELARDWKTEQSNYSFTHSLVDILAFSYIRTDVLISVLHLRTSRAWRTFTAAFFAALSVVFLAVKWAPFHFSSDNEELLLFIIVGFFGFSHVFVMASTRPPLPKTFAKQSLQSKFDAAAEDKSAASGSFDEEVEVSGIESLSDFSITGNGFALLVSILGVLSSYAIYKSFVISSASSLPFESRVSDFLLFSTIARALILGFLRVVDDTRATYGPAAIISFIMVYTGCVAYLILSKNIAGGIEWMLISSPIIAWVDAVVAANGLTVRRSTPKRVEDENILLYLPLHDMASKKFTDFSSFGADAVAYGQVEVATSTWLIKKEELLGLFPVAHLPSLAADFVDGKGFLRIENLHLDDCDNITLAAWVCPTPQDGSSWGSIFSNINGLDDKSNPGFCLAIDRMQHLAATINVVIGSNVHNTKIAESGILPSGTWQHVALVIDTNVNSVSLFRNGREVARKPLASSVTSRSIRSKNHSAVVAAHYAGKTQDISEKNKLTNYTGNFDGMITDLWMWNQVKSVDFLHEHMEHYERVGLTEDDQLDRSSIAKYAETIKSTPGAVKTGRTPISVTPRASIGSPLKLDEAQSEDALKDILQGQPKFVVPDGLRAHFHRFIILIFAVLIIVSLGSLIFSVSAVGSPLSINTWVSIFRGQSREAEVTFFKVQVLSLHTAVLVTGFLLYIGVTEFQGLSFLH